MTNFVEDIQKLNKDNMDAIMANVGVVSKTLQSIATETADYSKKSFEEGTAAVEKLMGVKTIDKVMEVQSEYAKSSYEGFVGQATKIGEMYTEMCLSPLKLCHYLFSSGVYEDGTKETFRRRYIEAVA